jgi:hypothetical protein
MCDCEELEFEDFQVMLAALSKPTTTEKAPLEAPLIQVAAPKRAK